MNEIKANARRLLVAHGFSDVAETTDNLNSPHEIRVLVLKRCAPVGFDIASASNMPGVASGAFEMLVVGLDATTKRIESAAPRDRSVSLWHDEAPDSKEPL